MHRPTLGVIGALLLVAGAVGIWLAAPGTQEYLWASIVLRSGAVMGAIWLALPAIRGTSKRTLVVIAILAAVLVLRPKMVVLALPILLVLALLTPRFRRSTRR
jgi:hypothetical protein